MDLPARCVRSVFPYRRVSTPDGRIFDCIALSSASWGRWHLNWTDKIEQKKASPRVADLRKEIIKTLYNQVSEQGNGQDRGRNGILAFPNIDDTD
jgi:hypothetical protein